IDILTKIYVYTQLDIPVPFTDRSNGTAQKECTPYTANNWGTGGKGSISIYISHPFVGQMIIPKTRVASLFGTKKKGVYNDSQPMANVSISGSITVTQGCEL
ncbi:long polar fimbrial protein LpfD, partial [Salmonella enterica subsp. enterica serovar Kentucky]|nr:long polar fimbrial protein LpfD [Salmonella enterica subsp. enterica serovar Kentucky]